MATDPVPTIAQLMADFARLPRPGIAKIRAVPLVNERHLTLTAPNFGRWRELLDGADVMSEGRSKDELGELVYYGSTSLLIASVSGGGALPDLWIVGLARLLAHDPHVRLRAVRVAQREAIARADAPLGPIRAELSVSASPRGVSLLVDVTARVERTHARRARR